MQVTAPPPRRFALTTIVLRTAARSSLDALDDGTPVVVEIDRLDEDRRVGWSVIVHGHISHIDDDVLTVVGDTVHPWAPADKVRWMWVIPHSITGRAISRPPAAASLFSDMRFLPGRPWVNQELCAVEQAGHRPQ